MNAGGKNIQGTMKNGVLSNGNDNEVILRDLRGVFNGAFKANKELTEEKYSTVFQDENVTPFLNKLIIFGGLCRNPDLLNEIKNTDKDKLEELRNIVAAQQKYKSPIEGIPNSLEQSPIALAVLDVFIAVKNACSLV